MKIGQISFNGWNDVLSIHGAIQNARRYGEPNLSGVTPDISSTGLAAYKDLAEHPCIDSVTMECSYEYDNPLTGGLSYSNSRPGLFVKTVKFSPAVTGTELAQALLPPSNLAGSRPNIGDCLIHIAKRKNANPSLDQLTNIVHMDQFKKNVAETGAVISSERISGIRLTSLRFRFDIKVGNVKRVCECGHKSTTTNGFIKHKASCKKITHTGYKPITSIRDIDLIVLYEKLEQRGYITWMPTSFEPCTTLPVWELLRLAKSGDLGMSADGVAARLDELLTIMDEAREDKDGSVEAGRVDPAGDQELRQAVKGSGS